MGACQSVDDFDYSKLGLGSVNLKLTETDINLIKASWDSIKTNPEVGIAIMIRYVRWILGRKKIFMGKLLSTLWNRIFKVHTSIKHVWIFAQNLTTDEEIRNDSQVRYHSSRLLNALDKIINQLDADISKNQEFLIDLGVKHFHYDVKYEYFKVILILFLVGVWI